MPLLRPCARRCARTASKTPLWTQVAAKYATKPLGTGVITPVLGLCRSSRPTETKGQARPRMSSRPDNTSQGERDIACHIRLQHRNVTSFVPACLPVLYCTVLCSSRALLLVCNARCTHRTGGLSMATHTHIDRQTDAHTTLTYIQLPAGNLTIPYRRQIKADVATTCPLALLYRD